MENRISVKFRCPNPLFEKWLTEWRDQAKEKNLKTQHAYSLALASLRKYPLPLHTGNDCKILKGFGSKVCTMLDEALKNYKKNQSSEGNIGVLPINKPRKSKSIKEPQQKSVDNDDECDYLPTYKSGAYAILFTLYEKSLENNYKGFLLKNQLIEEAQLHCDTSFSKPKVGSFYTAWSSMKTLISKGLVHKEGNPAKFSLTNKGVLLGCKLYTREDNLSVNKATRTSSSEEVEDFGQSFSGEKPVKHKDNECIILSDSEDEESYKVDSAISKEIVPISNELEEICGVFSNKENEIEIPLFKPSKKIVNVNSTDGNETKEGSSENKISEYEDFIMTPNTFNVILLVDAQETSGKQIDPKNDAILKEIERLNVNYEVRNLKVGDYCWVGRHSASGKEFVLPYIVERKRMDDLASSIKDGRFREQKFRLKQCGLQNVIYMIESYGTKDEHVGLPINSLCQAIINTFVQDGFTIKIVEGVRGVAEYLSCMSMILKKNYENKTIVSCPRENISDISIKDDLISLMSFQDFNKLSSKKKVSTAKEMLVQQLLQIKGFSVDKASAIVEIYPTNKVLKDMIIENGRKSVNIISNIKYGQQGKKIGAVLSENIYIFYSQMSAP